MPCAVQAIGLTRRRYVMPGPLPVGHVQSHSPEVRPVPVRPVPLPFLVAGYRQQRGPAHAVTGAVPVVPARRRSAAPLS